MSDAAVMQVGSVRPAGKDDYRKKLADAFIQALQENDFTWKKEWSYDKLPRNAVTNRKYSGVNQFALMLIASLRGYDDPRWLTMNQIMDKKEQYHKGQTWHLQRGSKATYVEYWYPYDWVNKIALTWDDMKKISKDPNYDPSQYTLRTKYFAVFNASCVDGIPPMESEKNNDIQPAQILDTITKNMGVTLKYDGGNRAYYSPSSDEVHLPEPSQFYSEYAYQATAFHELAHATGHPDRLDRDHSGFFGTPAYAFEELVAEITSCFTAAGVGLEQTTEHMENHKAYVQSWIQALQKDPNKLIDAIRLAEDAASYLDWKAELISEKEFRTTKSEKLPKELQKETEKEQIRERNGEAR